MLRHLAVACALALLPAPAPVVAEETGNTVCVAVSASPSDPGYLHCLSLELAGRALADGADARSALDSAAGARDPSGPAAMGLYTQAATRLRLGPNFGHSVVPYRPSLEYRSPLIPSSGAAPR